MGNYSGTFVSFDVAKAKHAVAIAEGGRAGEVRFVGEIENTPAAIARMIKKLADRYGRLHVCYEAGPTGYGLYRQIRDLDLRIYRGTDATCLSFEDQPLPFFCLEPVGMGHTLQIPIKRPQRIIDTYWNR